MAWFFVTEIQLQRKRVGELVEMYQAHCPPPHLARKKDALAAAIYRQARLERDAFCARAIEVQEHSRQRPAVAHCITASDVNAWLATLPPTPFAGDAV